MATERPNKNPYSQFNFVVEIDGQQIAGFSEVSGLDSENSPFEYRAGNDPINAVRKLPGMEQYPNASFKRGITGSLALWEWRNEVRNGGAGFPPYRTVVIKLLNEQSDEGTPAMTWTLYNAWPTKLSGPTLSATSNEYAVETLEVCYDRLDIS